MNATSTTPSRPNLPPRPLALTLATGALLLAALMRVYHITQQSIWFDEAFAWNIVRQPDMYPRIAADTHPPLYYLFLRVWVSLTGDSPLALRYLSALFAILTVALVYRLAVELCRQRDWPGRALWVPFAAGVFMALTDAEIDLAQEARNYTLYTLLGCASMWLYLRWLRSSESSSGTDTRQARITLALWVVANAALVYTHYQGVFIPLVQGLHVLIFVRRRFWVAIAALAVAGAIFLPWFLGVTVPQAQNAVENDIPFSIPSSWETFNDLLTGFFTGQWPLVSVLAALGLVAVTTRGVRLRPFGPTFLIAAWLVVPFALLFFGNHFAALLTERKLAIITPAIALLVAFGLGNARQPAATLLLAAIAVYGVYNVDFYRLKEPWDAIAQDAVVYAGEHDLALIETGNGQYPMRYYWEREMPESVWVDTFPVLGDPTMSVTTDWFTYYDLWLPQLFELNQQDRVGPVATVWLAFWYDEQTSIERLEAAGYVRTMTITHFHLGNAIDLYRYDMLPDDPAATYDSGLVLRAVEVDAADRRIDLWWSEAGEAAGELVTSALLLDDGGQVVAQRDSVPFMGQRPVAGWADGAVVFDPKWLEPAGDHTAIPPGDYTLAVQVYRFNPDGTITQSLLPDGARWYEAGTITIE